MLQFVPFLHLRDTFIPKKMLLITLAIQLLLIEFAAAASTLLLPMIGNENVNSLVPRLSLTINGRLLTFSIYSTTSSFWVNPNQCKNSCPAATRQTSSQGDCNPSADTVQIGQLKPTRMSICQSQNILDMGSKISDGVIGISPNWKGNKALQFLFSKMNERIVTLYWFHPRKYGSNVIGLVGIGQVKGNQIASVVWSAAYGNANLWNIASIGMSLGGDRISFINGASIDTTSDECFFEPPVFAAIVKYLDAKFDHQAQRYSVNYRFVSDLAPIKLRLGNSYVDVDPLVFVNYNFDHSSENDFAYLSIKERLSGPSLLGTNLLSNFHIILDFDKLLVGFGTPIRTGAKRKGDAEPDSSNPSKKPNVAINTETI